MTTINQNDRIRSIDMVRGAVMVLMALDHVRVYSGIPAGGSATGIFLTRWITNFCAPAFVFLAGVSIFLHRERVKDRAALSRWLVVRGAWLVLLELTYLRLAWTFNVEFANYMLAGVIWMLGWCMIVMAVLVRLPLIANAVFGLVIIAGHNLIALALQGSHESLLQGKLGPLWRVLYFGGGIAIGHSREPNLWVLYSIIPWIGVMAAGYAFGPVFRMSPEKRERACYTIGGATIAAFAIAQSMMVYRGRGPSSNAQVPFWIAFLTATKYPASLLFLLMTLAGLNASLFCPSLNELERMAAYARWLTVFGRVPLFFFICCAYPTRPCDGSRYLARAFTCCDRLALRKPPDAAGPTARRLRLEPWIALPRHRGGCRFALLPLPLVRAPQSAAKRHLPLLPVIVAPRVQPPDSKIKI